MRTMFFSAWLTVLFGLSGLPLQAVAEPGGTSAGEGAGAFSQAELDQMMAPVALYPDSLLSQLLMAATYPSQVAEAYQWSKQNSEAKGDDAVDQVQDRGWDPSVASLVAFPQVLAMMGAKPDWVKQMGDAFLADTDAVMNTIQALRRKAKEAGNLESGEQQKVVVEQKAEKTVIVIEPADPEVIYVPAYNPTVIYGTWWWPAYPPYYYPPPPGWGFATGIMAGIGFGIGIAITNSLWGGCNWHRNDININVNRYNKINVGNRLNVKNTNVSWKERNVRRRDEARISLDDRRPRTNKLAGAEQRRDFRGRDAEREKARAAMKDRGIDPVRERGKLSGAEGAKVRDKVKSVDRDNLSVGKRDDKPLARTRDSGLSSRGDHAFKGLGDKRSNLSTDRGQSSRRSFERSGGGHAGGGRLGGGGGGFGGGAGGGRLGGGGFGRH